MPKDANGNVVGFENPEDAAFVDAAEEIDNNLVLGRFTHSSSSHLADKLFDRDINVIRGATAVLNNVGSFATNGKYKQLPVLDDKAVERMRTTFGLNLPPSEDDNFTKNDYDNAFASAIIKEYVGEQKVDLFSVASMMKSVEQIRYPLYETNKEEQNVYMAARAADCGVAIMGQRYAYDAIVEADKALNNKNISIPMPQVDPMQARLAQAQALVDNVVDTPSGPDDGLSY